MTIAVLIPCYNEAKTIAKAGAADIANSLNGAMDARGVSTNTNALINNDILTVADVTQLTRSDLKSLKGFGQKAFEEILEKIEEMGINLAE